MTQAKQGDKVEVSYVGKLEDGTIFDQSPNGETFSFTLGGGEMIPELESHIIGMTAGETKNMVVSPDKAFGVWNKEYVVNIPADRVPKELDPKKGSTLELEVEGEVVPGRVVEMDEKVITVDLNHPLAGQTLYFKLKLEDVKS